MTDCLHLSDTILWNCQYKYKEPFHKFLIPPVSDCLQCHGTLYTFNVTNVTVFTLEGPLPARKLTLRCKKGCGATYSIDTYNSSSTTKFYDFPTQWISASNKVFISDTVHELMCESGNHAFVSHHAFSKIYASVFNETANGIKYMEWIKEFEDQASDVDSSEDSTQEDLKDDDAPCNDSGAVKLPTKVFDQEASHECLSKWELANELRQRSMSSTMGMTTKMSRELVMQEIDKMRRQEHYPHDPSHCTAECKKKVCCENLRVIDGCWKVCMPHCMFAMEMEVQGFPLLNFPNVCTSEPKPGSVFCADHYKILKEKNIPTQKEEFLQFIGCKSNINLRKKKMISNKCDEENSQEDAAKRYCPCQPPTDGDVLVSLADGDVHISLSVGDVPVSQSYGDVPVSQSDGDVPVSQSDGDVPVSQSDGDIPFSLSDGDNPISLADYDVCVSQSDKVPISESGGDGPFSQSDSSSVSENQMMVTVYADILHVLVIYSSVEDKNPSSSEDIKAVDDKIKEFSKQLASPTAGVSSLNYQNTEQIVSQVSPSDWQSTSTDTICNKDTGEKARLRQRSRGHFVCVTGGGHIQYFEPLFKSEGPCQIFMITIRSLLLELSKVPEDQLEARMKSLILAYDKMCHLDCIKAPLNKLWKTIKKIVDRLHLQNHKDARCKVTYDPSTIPESYNTMIAEQTFSWFSRFKKIANSMTQTHHLFYIHRQIQRRNKYSGSCRLRGKSPLLPGINITLQKKAVKD
ncbi:unnamed protein product [Mytilus edulis]|uniref:CxC5 like cysteine cluster associated with KDZ domain-containing protein n=1 Tax=Mytilus edulis TaxID=6550 RepID=A0A8S3RIM0_MYTED|nr:unnamed protein product [Mytilus edulis]